MTKNGQKWPPKTWLLDFLRKSSFLRLLKKLQHYGIKGKNLSWFESYLTGRKQYIKFEINDNNGKTGLLKITCGVPQGSILGPLLFIIYINYLCQVSDILRPVMFADDTKLFCSGNDLKTLSLNTNSFKWR